MMRSLVALHTRTKIVLTPTCAFSALALASFSSCSVENCYLSSALPCARSALALVAAAPRALENLSLTRSALRCCCSALALACSALRLLCASSRLLFALYAWCAHLLLCKLERKSLSHRLALFLRLYSLAPHRARSKIGAVVTSGVAFSLSSSLKLSYIPRSCSRR